MFELKNKILHLKGIYNIHSNYTSLINDGDNDIIYIGTNRFGSLILGSILFEDDENFFLRYIHSLISDEELNDFLNRKTTLKSIIENSNTTFIVDKDYNKEIINSALIPLKDIPSEYIPLENSYCPEFVKNNSFNYSFSLKGKLADMHKANPEIVSSTTTKIYKLLDNATNFLNELDIYPRILSEVSKAGSYELNFEIDLTETPTLFSVSNSDIKGFIISFFQYLFNQLPDEPAKVLKEDKITSEKFVALRKSLKTIYERRNFVLKDISSEQKVLDLINYSVDAIKDLEYVGYDRIEIKNQLNENEVLPIALIPSNYYEKISEKVFKVEGENKEDLVVLDDEPGKYKIQVYSFNKETGNGGAYYDTEESVNKIQLHLRGKTDYHNTIYTKSLDENKKIDVTGIGKWINNILKEITVNL